MKINISFLVIGVFLLTSCLQSSLSVSRLHKDDKYRWITNSKVAHLRISCPHGIGSAVVSTEDDWPPSLIIILPMSALEGFTLNADDRQYRLEVTNDHKVIIEPDMRNPLSLVSDKNRAGDDAYWVHVDMTLLNTEESNLLISWVDYYR